MENIIIKNELIKVTKDLVLGVILNEMIEISQNFRKEFIENNWHCPEFFEINLEKISKDNFLNLSQSSMRRYIKKLKNLGFITVDTIEKRHKYKVNFEKINLELEKIGCSEKKIEDKNIKKEIKKECNECNYSFEDIKEAPDKNKELIKYIQKNINYANNYTKIKEKCQGHCKENLALFKDIYNIIIDTVTSKRGSLMINKQEKDIEIVKSVFMKLTEIDVNQAIAKIKNISYEIKNIKGYITSILYNGYIERNIGIKISTNHLNININDLDLFLP